MKALVRVAGVSTILVGAAGCALIAGIEDFNVVASDAGDGVVTTNDDGATGQDGSGTVDVDGGAAVDGALPDVTVAQDGGTMESSAADVVIPTDSPVVTEAGGCTATCAPTQSCENGECWPQAIATGRPSPSSIIVVSGSVVWVETQGLSDAVVACPSTGCTTTPTPVRTGLTSAVVRRAAPTMNTLVELDQGASSARTISSALTTPTITQEDHLWGAAASSGTVLYGARDKVKFCAPPCSGAQQLTFGHTPPTGPAMAIDAARAYWTPPNHGVQSCDLPSCATPISFGDGRTFVDFEVDAKGVTALSSNALVFFDSAGTDSGSVSLTGGTALVALAPTFYVTTTGGILAVDATSHAASPRWPASSPRGLATDGTFLYWTEGSSVFRAPK